MGTIPRGIEVLVKKAAVDAEFRLVLLDQRADAAGRQTVTSGRIRTHNKLEEYVK
jgi:hypothetical protein